MRGRLDPHARYRELLAARVDRPLTRGENRLLVGHLRSCAACQQVDREYRDQRSLLRSLSTPVPPRDMWARTSTALDREMSRWEYRFPRLGRRRLARAGRSAGAPSALATVVAALGVVTALVALQLAPALRPAEPSTTMPLDTAVALGPTPFAIPPQKIALVAADAADLTFYETQVDQVCPQSAPDCVGDSQFVERHVSIPSDVKPRNVTQSAAGRLAFVGDDGDRDVIAVVLLSTDARPPPVRPTQTDRPTPTPSAVPSTSEPPPGSAEETPTPTLAASETPTNSEGTTSPPSTPDTSGDPSTDPSPVSPDPTPSDAATDPPTEIPTEIPSIETPQPIPTPVVEPTPTLEVVITDAPASATLDPDTKVVSILEDVLIAGAPPAWSRDGEVLAFSAMPADGSQGPDVYIWQLGDSSARAITSDHASFFASWSGRGRVVLSRLADAGEGESGVPATVVIDLQTNEERQIDGPQMWLPVVDPTRNLAVTWRGTLDLTGALPEPEEGGLYVVQWAPYDPFRFGGGASVAPEEGDVHLVRLHPDRDTQADPVLDWQARWSPDGRVLGIWEAEAPASSWGNLVLVAADPESGTLNLGQPLLERQFAKRGFTLGIDGVAWIGPSDDATAGELRIRTWGTDGVGDLRIESLRPHELVPSF